MSDMVELRPVEAGDEEFLRRVYASSRAAELALLPWDEAQTEAFLRWQFDAQDRWYGEQYATAGRQVVLVDGEPAGRLYVHRSETEILIVDIALLAEHRGHGVGTALLREVLAEGYATGRRVTIHVERFNRALALYRRLGFRLVEDQGVYLFLERPPAYVKTAS